MLQEQDIAAGTVQPLVRACADASATAHLLDDATAAWHNAIASPDGPLLTLHRANFELWHLEDQARDRRSGDAAVAATKRSIDAVNQRRNDTVEAIDTALLAYLQHRELPVLTAPLHSETPGQMLDRLSILSLKIFHTAQEADRVNAGAQHHQRNATRLVGLREQQADLAGCLSVLWEQVMHGERRFKQYRQMKMYNDPTLNPVLYSVDAAQR